MSLSATSHGKTGCVHDATPEQVWLNDDVAARIFRNNICMRACTPLPRRARFKMDCRRDEIGMSSYIVLIMCRSPSYLGYCTLLALDAS